MEINISYRHLDSSPAVDAKIREKLEHLKKYFHGKMNVNWVCSVDGHQQHKSEVNINVGQNNFHANAVDKNLYNTLDMALNKIESQVRKKNEKVKDKIHRH
jgi:putative sigma-54 modulation protein